MAARLRSCSGCARHVRISETACPFCSAALPESVADAPTGDAASLTRGRITRAAILFASATVVAACGGKETADDGSFIPVPPYGLPPFDAGAEDGGRDAAGATGDGGRDAAGDAGADASRDAGRDASYEGGGVPLYGPPPFDG